MSCRFVFAILSFVFIELLESLFASDLVYSTCDNCLIVFINDEMVRYSLAPLPFDSFMNFWDHIKVVVCVTPIVFRQDLLCP